MLLRCIPSNFGSIRLKDWKEMSFEEIQDGLYAGHLEYRYGTILVILNLHVNPIPQIKFRLNLTYGLRGDVVWRIRDGHHGGHRGGHLAYTNGTILAILNLHVTPMPPVKFRLNPTSGLGGDVSWRTSRWPPWRSFWKRQRSDISVSEIPCSHNASH